MTVYTLILAFIQYIINYYSFNIRFIAAADIFEKLKQTIQLSIIRLTRGIRSEKKHTGKTGVFTAERILFDSCEFVVFAFDGFFQQVRRDRFG